MAASSRLRQVYAQAVAYKQTVAQAVTQLKTSAAMAQIAATAADWTNGATGAISTRTLKQKTADTLSIKDFGATGDGVTDDAPAIRLARTYMAARGGGVLKVPAGTYLLASTDATYFGTGYAVDFPVGQDGVVFEGEGAASVFAMGADIRMFGINVASIANWWNATVYSPTGSPAKGARTVALAAGGGAHFATDDWILIRTGNCTAAYTAGSAGQPDSEINRVKSISTDTLTLYYPLAKDYAQEYFTADPVGSPNACGPTTTSVTAWLAPFGVANINAYMLHAPKFRNLTLRSTYDKTLIAGGQCYGFTLDNCDISSITTPESMSAHRGSRFYRNRARIQAASSAQITYCFSVAWGCVDTIIESNTIDSDGDCEILHVHEGAAQTHIRGNTLNGTSVSGGLYTIGVLGRAYDTIITNNIIRGLSLGGTISVDATVLGGGVISGNHFWNEVYSTTVSVLGTGFTVRGNTIAVGKLSVTIGNTTDWGTEVIYIPAGAFSPNVSTPTDTLIGSFVNGLAMVHGTDVAAVAGFAIPDGWKTFTVSFFYATLASAGAANVRWRVRCQDVDPTQAVALASLTTIFTSDFTNTPNSGANLVAPINTGVTSSTLSTTKRYAHLWIERQGSTGTDTDTRVMYLVGAAIKRVS